MVITLFLILKTGTQNWTPYKNIHKKTSSFIGLVELQDFKDFVLNGNVSFFKWLYELVTADCLFYYNKRDTKPVRAYICYLLKKYLKKIVRL